jgi:hypothetical protein
MAVTAFASRLAEVAAAVEARLPRTALQRLLDEGRREEESIRSLERGPERDQVVAALLANFFRYQLARNPRLAAWWAAVRPADQPGAEDSVLSWLRDGGVSRLERLTELLSIEPIPRETQTGLEALA